MWNHMKVYIQHSKASICNSRICQFIVANIDLYLLAPAYAFETACVP